MSRRVALRLSASGAGLVAVVSLARADAPPGQYAQFSREDTVITDDGTRLRWQRVATYQATSFADAQGYCAALSLGGLGAWRVPSYKELLTLVDEAPHTEYPTGAPVTIAIDGNAFPGTNPGVYWSSSADAQTSGNAYAVRFSDGQSQSAPVNTTGYSVRCVHD